MVCGIKAVPLMETITGLPLMLLLLCLMTREFLPNTNAHLMNCWESEREALIDFKNGLNDPANRLSSWKGSNCCQWRGISCDNTSGAVIAVDLRDPHQDGFQFLGRYVHPTISGDISPSLMKLKSLRHLDLSLNAFIDNPIPEFLGSLKNLQYLNLSNAGFSGAIPQNLGNLSSLQYLDLDNSLTLEWQSGLYVDNLDWVTGLVSLKHLDMDAVDLSNVGSHWIMKLNKLSFLTELHLSDCSLSGSIPPLTFVNLTSLVVLDLRSNDLNSKIPDWLVNISSLVTLDLNRGRFFGRIPLGFSDLPNLQFLYLGHNDLTASCHQLLGGRWEKIQELDFESISLHGKLPASIGNMTFLTFLNLFSNNVKGGIPSSIGKLCNLVYFDIGKNNLTGTLPEFLAGIENCLSRRPLPSLQVLHLPNNHLVGKLPEWLTQLANLVELDLSSGNSLCGPIPASFGILQQNLTYLNLNENELNGTLPESLGQLSKLSFLDVSSNRLTGIVTETHFLKLEKLRVLDLSSNSFTLAVNSDWVSPFQVETLLMDSCRMGPSFPAWLKSQKRLTDLNLSNTSISGSIPFWFWEHFLNLKTLNVSNNQLEGQLPSHLNYAPTLDIGTVASFDLSSNSFSGAIPVLSGDFWIIDLSKNKFSGTTPNNISFSNYLKFLFISDNQISGEIPPSIGKITGIYAIDLSSNNLMGNIPSSIGNCTSLEVLDLSKNKLSGNIPGSLGQLSKLKSLHLSDNKFSGELPTSFQNLSSLETLDLGNNRFMGRIPQWIGEGFQNLRILSLRSNAFSGELPLVLSNLSSIQLMDLAGNQLSGSIPASFGNLKAMTQVQNHNNYHLYGGLNGYYEENFVVTTKNQHLEFTKSLSLVVSLDLSGNNLNGDLPGEITNLLGLVFLNLSRNHISGHIPESISRLTQLSSLDLSHNKFSGAIPQSLGSLSFLGYLNLSDNDFTGKIPYKDQMITFSASSYVGNHGLCGSPLDVKCPGDEDNDDTDKGSTIHKDNSNGGSFIDNWFYLSVGLGFAAGILVPFLVMSMRKSWSVAYFDAVEKVSERILYLWLKYRTMQQRNRGHQHRR